MTFKTKLDDDVNNKFLNTDEFAETISYTPYGGAAKPIKAIVTRNRLNPDSQNQGHVLINQVEIQIANDATNGVASVNKGQDTVSLPAIIGDSASTWRIVDILDHDSAMWRLLARK